MPKVKAEKPTKKSKAEKPTKKSKAEKPAKKAKVEKPAKKAKVEKPAKKAKVEKPAKKAKLLKGKHTIQIKRNPKTATKVGKWVMSDLHEAKYNPRIISDKELANLERSLKEFGDLSGVVYNRFTGSLISGHQRLRSLSKDKIKIVTKPVSDAYGTTEEGDIVVKTVKGIIRIPIRIVDWPERKAELAANIAANAHGGNWDHKKLAIMTEDLAVYEDFDISIVGLDSTTLASMSHLPGQIGHSGSSSSSIGPSFQEYDSESFDDELTHTCPRCSFSFGG